jgi:hypothetical protein
MNRFLPLVLVTAATSLAAQAPSPVSGQTGSVSFNKDVLPILQQNCQICHRTGEVAPMSFLTYESTRPWAKAIKQAVLTKKMPPWFADPHYGGFRNAPKLTDADIKTLAAWADGGALEGDPQEKPQPVSWPAGWHIRPDVIVSMPEAHNVTAKGSGEIKSFDVPNPFKEDTWINAIEIRPGEPSVVHHVMLQVPEETPGPRFSWGGVSGSTCTPAAAESFLETPIPINTNPRGPQVKPPKNFALLEAVYVPGTSVTDFRYENSAKLIKGGGNLRIEVHYTPNGKAVSDLTRIGFSVAKEGPQRKFVMLAPKSMANAKVPIPAGAENWETQGELEFGQDAQLVWLMPHMHLRGKDMTFNLVYPNGRTETVLRAHFNFNWQLGYELEEPLRVRKGTKMIVTAHHDNSANNPYNPAPDKEVAWGNLTSEEMVLPWFGVIVDSGADPEKILSVRRGGCSAINTLLSLPRIAPKLPSRLPVPLPPVFSKKEEKD